MRAARPRQLPARRPPHAAACALTCAATQAPATLVALSDPLLIDGATRLAVWTARGESLAVSTLQWPSSSGPLPSAPRLTTAPDVAAALRPWVPPAAGPQLLGRCIALCSVGRRILAAFSRGGVFSAAAQGGSDSRHHAACVAPHGSPAACTFSRAELSDAWSCALGAPGSPAGTHALSICESSLGELTLTRLLT